MEFSGSIYMSKTELKLKDKVSKSYHAANKITRRTHTHTRL